MIRRVVLQTGSIMLLLVLSMIMGGCSILFGGGGQPEATPTAAPRALVPTFTPTPVVEQAPAPTPVPPTPTQIIAVELAGESATEPAPEEGTGEEGTEAPADASPTATPVPKLTVKVDAVNVRLGPGTEYGLAGLVNQGQEFTIVGRNEAKTWWLICCVNGKEVWIFDDLTDEDNEKFAPIITDIPAPPVAQAQPPAAQPEPTPTTAPEPQPAADPCAGIGGDGCKFKLRGSPKFAPNGGTELKFQVHFIHSGVDGGQPQGSYFVWVEKDGTKLPISDSVRSIALQDQQGAL
ncbi:MAG: hypothetical protein H3C34_09910, partial [Caldilineaceae bacterium]|nr:hypothetical protein [Caldilineaceae bacterium]